MFASLVLLRNAQHPVIIFLLDGIELMVMALRALDGDAEDAFADGLHAIEHGFHAELFGVDAAFLVDHGVAQEACGDDLVLGGVGKKIACDLVDDELVVGQVAVERVDHPVAIEPDGALLVLFVAVGIGVAGGVEPGAGPFFPVVRRFQETVYLLFVGVGAFVA